LSYELEYYRNLAQVMLKTRGARFTAASSLGVRERWSIGTTSLLTVFILSWSVFLVADPDAFSTPDVRFFGALSIISSVAVLTLTLLDYALGRTVRAEKLQQSALQISLIMRALERELCSDTPDIAAMRRLAIEYETAVAETQLNHAPSDFRKWEIGSEKPTTLKEKVWWALRSTTFNIGYYLSPVILHLLTLLIVIGLAGYYTWKH
jgi:hypothetical protein